MQTPQGSRGWKAGSRQGTHPPQPQPHGHSLAPSSSLPAAACAAPSTRTPVPRRLPSFQPLREWPPAMFSQPLLASPQAEQNLLQPRPCPLSCPPVSVKGGWWAVSLNPHFCLKHHSFGAHVHSFATSAKNTGPGKFSVDAGPALLGLPSQVGRSEGGGGKTGEDRKETPPGDFSGILRFQFAPLSPTILPRGC